MPTPTPGERERDLPNKKLRHNARINFQWDDSIKPGALISEKEKKTERRWKIGTAYLNSRTVIPINTHQERSREEV